MKPLSRAAIVGYPAGVITGISYGLNPLFAMPLMMAGASIGSILFFRYSFAVLLLGAYLVARGERLRITWREGGVLLVLGLLYAASSIFLFEAYRFIPSGLATTLIFLYPVIVALIMVFLGVRPSWKVWVAVVATFAGVIIMTRNGSAQSISPMGIVLSIGSAVVYSLFIVIINRSRIIRGISNGVLTFYALCVGATIFGSKLLLAHQPPTAGIEGFTAWSYLVGLALLPTIVSTATLAIATRNIGATKASVLGVFEPITAILIGTLVFGEALTVNIVLGITIAVVAVVFMIMTTKR